VMAADAHPLFVTLASVRVSEALVKPHFPAAAAVRAATCALVAGAAVTVPEEVPEPAAGDAAGWDEGAGVLGWVALWVGVAATVAGGGGAELAAEPHAAARHRAPAASPIRPAVLPSLPPLSVTALRAVPAAAATRGTSGARCCS
jgi:hypothetical protein